MAEAKQETEDPISWDKVRHLQYLHSVAEKYKDTVFVRTSVLLAATAFQTAMIGAVVGGFWKNLGASENWLRAIIVIAFVWQLGAGGIGLLAIMPLKNLMRVSRIIGRSTEYHSSSETVPLLSAFNHVYRKERGAFVGEMGTADKDKLFNDLCVTYYNLCHIVNSRYGILRRGYLVQLIGIAWNTMTVALVLIFH
ncbi:MAG TPA: hypothetical protein VHR45_00100 [Thermoanaerobaculia bacterium]|nr:hypothetical protein [Thermoanaerobaculia bacterium]